MTFLWGHMTPFTGQYTTANEEIKAQRPNRLDADLIGLRPISRRKTSSFFLAKLLRQKVFDYGNNQVTPSQPVIMIETR